MASMEQIPLCRNRIDFKISAFKTGTKDTNKQIWRFFIFKDLFILIMYAQNGLYNVGENVNDRDTNTVVIFLPKYIVKADNSVYLYGDFEINQNSTKTFYITKTCDFYSDKCMGIYSTGTVNGTSSRRNWIYLEAQNDSVKLKKLKFNNELQDIRSQQIILLHYDPKSILKLDSSCDNGVVKEDYFKNLGAKLRCNGNGQSKNLNFMSRTLIFIFLILQNLIVPMAKYSNIALHINNYLGGFIWALRNSTIEGIVNIKVVNFFLSTLLDMALGVLFLNWLTSKVSLDSFPRFFLLTAENVVNSLKELVQWLMGDPAGLKLNLAFNKMLATFYLFHIHIWWSFLVMLKPGLKFMFLLFLHLGQLGITFQASIISDLLGLVSFHVYCIYAYAARLYNVQISALIALWRLFLGRKKNPLRKKVDSCKYSPEQLFVGTIAFTILLFLLPTTLVYYVVFAFIRVLIIAFGGILIRVSYVVQSLPIYSTVIWLIRSSEISSSIELIPLKSHIKSNFLVLDVKPIPDSWWRTIHRFQPECVPKPVKFDLNEFCGLLFSGKLIYPVDFTFFSWF